MPIYDTKKILTFAREKLLDSSGLALKDAEHGLSSMLMPKVNYADLYFQFSQAESWYLEDSKVKEGGFHSEKGVGVRAISGEKTGFAFADSIDAQSLLRSCNAAKRIARSGESCRVKVKHQDRGINKLYIKSNPLGIDKKLDKIALLHVLDRQARNYDRRVKEVRVSLSGNYRIILVMASDGTLAADIQPLVRLNVSVIVAHGEHRESGSFGGGGRHDYKIFFKDNFKLAKEYAEEAARIAVLNLQAKDVPAGNMPLVLAPGWPGVLLHEAIGHGLEGDFNRKNLSAFSGRIGQRVANSVCTIVDRGNLPKQRGSVHIDDEGTPTQCTTLIENGVLRCYMLDKLNAKLMGKVSTGNGRRESYAAVPIPRMTNTYMLPGKYSRDEIISSVKEGIYAVNFNGGQVDITSGKFVFVTNEAYLIKNGKLSYPVKGATLIGNGPDILTKVSMVGNDLSLDTGVGTCGKEGQNVPVCVGQPTLKVDEIVVGGTE